MPNFKLKAEDYFLQHSKLSKHPNFKRLLQDHLDIQVLEQETKSTKGNAYKHTKSGYRKDLGLNLRSNWEANFARILNAYKVVFEFEPKVFTFPVKRGTKGYTPDFYLPNFDEWVEIKGYLDDKSKIKIKRFKRYYPNEFEKMTFICSRYSSDAKKFAEELEIPSVLYYEDIRDFYFTKIPNWEGK
jgi:hypothetical protein